MTIEIMLVLAILVITVVLLLTEKLRVDVIDYGGVGGVWFVESVRCGGGVF